MIPSPGMARKQILPGIGLTSMEQECALLHQPDVGVNDNKKETTTSTQQAAVREEFVSHTEKRQGTIAWATEQHKQFDRGRFL